MGEDGRRLEKIEEIKKRKETAKKIPNIENKEVWSWREIRKEGPNMIPNTTPPNQDNK